MKTRWMVTLLVITGLSLMYGCSKKEEPKTPAKSDTTESKGMMDSMKEAADNAVNKTTDAAKKTADAVKESFSTNIDLEKTVSDLKAEAAKMDVESLTAVATKYKDAILAKQADMKTLMDKLAAIPATEKLGTEAKNLTAEIKTLTDAIAPLKERLAVYVDAIKAKGGSIQGLAL